MGVLKESHSLSLSSGHEHPLLRWPAFLDMLNTRKQNLWVCYVRRALTLSVWIAREWSPNDVNFISDMFALLLSLGGAFSQLCPLVGFCDSFVLGGPSITPAFSPAPMRIIFFFFFHIVRPAHFL